MKIFSPDLYAVKLHEAFRSYRIGMKRNEQVVRIRVESETVVVVAVLPRVEIHGYYLARAGGHEPLFVASHLR